jgi:hypothetical protein
MIIQKQPGTKMLINSPITKVWVSDRRFKNTYYEYKDPITSPLVTIEQGC